MPQPVKPTDDITFQRSELTKVIPRYTVVRDCVEQNVKEKATLYLPEPSTGAIKPEDNAARYASYLMRAVFYAVTSRTLAGMVGQTYARPPQVKVPSGLDVLIENATGSGLSLEQLSVDTMYDVMATGRAGLFVDYPTVAGPITVKQRDDGDIQPTITTYAPENIINWRTKKRGAKHVLSLVVLKETVDVAGVYSTETTTQYRELYLESVEGSDEYRVRVWTETPIGTGKDATTVWKDGGIITPKDGAGNSLTEIPFTFVGATNNDTEIDELPLYDLAQLNIAHYRNSADYEESSFIAGQPTPWFSGLTEEWVNDVFQGQILLGSRAAVPLPAGAQAGLLQIQANSMPMEAMKHKETQMVALGARLVENRSVRRTLGEVQQSNAAETSILASCANNVSTAYTFALRKAAAFVSANPDECAFKLNTDFALTMMDPQDRMQLIADLQAGLITFEEARAPLRRVGIATIEDATAKVAYEKVAAEANKPKPVGPEPDNRLKTGAK